MSWQDPDHASLTGYEYRKRLSSASTWDDAGTRHGWKAIPDSNADTTSYTLMGLDDGHRYTVQVRAVNDSGNGPASTVSETPNDPTLPPMIGEVSVSGTTLSATFEWRDTPSRSVWWELHRSTGQTSGFVKVEGPTPDSNSPVRFDNLARGYWYKIRGQTCESPASVPRSGSDSTTRSPTYVATSCGDWTEFSGSRLMPGVDTLPPNNPNQPQTCDDSDGTAPPCDSEPETCGDGTDPPCDSEPETCDDGTAPPCDDVVVPPPPPCAGKVQPPDFRGQPITSTSTDTRWVTQFVSPGFCVRYEEQRTTTTTTITDVTHVCDGECYVPQTATSVSTSTGTWSRTGNSEVCDFGRSDTTQALMLSAGVYELELEGQRILFDVPDSTQVVMTWQQSDEGMQEVVLTSGKDEELVIGSDALSGDERARSARFAGTSNATLRAIVDSLRAPQTATTATVSTTTTCTVVEAGEDGTSSVNLDTDSCAHLSQGGTVTVSRDGQSRSFVVSSEREWLAIGSSDSAAVTFIDIVTGSAITLSLSDGSEVRRHVPEGASELAPLFDAMRSSSPSESADEPDT